MNCIVLPKNFPVLVPLTLPLLGSRWWHTVGVCTVVSILMYKGSGESKFFISRILDSLMIRIKTYQTEFIYNKGSHHFHHLWIPGKGRPEWHYFPSMLGLHIERRWNVLVRAAAEIVRRIHSYNLPYINLPDTPINYIVISGKDFTIP